MPVNVSNRDLTLSFTRLREAADKLSDQPSHLLRFYSAECGLKAVVLRRLSLRSTSQLPEDLRSHDLRRLAGELRMSPADYAKLARCRRRLGNAVAEPPVEVHEIHQAWRYGAALHDPDESTFVAGLRSLEEWCRRELGR